MQINSINQQTFGANMLKAKKALAIDPKTKEVVASYTNFAAPINKFKEVLPNLGENAENKMYLVPKDFGDIICITCDGQASRDRVAKYLNESKGFDKVVIG